MSSQQRVLRGIVIFAAIWQVLWLAADAGLRELVVVEPTGVPSLLILASLLCWLLLWPLLFGPLSSNSERNEQPLLVVRSTIVVFLAVAGILLVASTRTFEAAGWYVGASIVNLAAGLAGLTFRRRFALGVVIAIVAVEAIAVIAVHGTGRDDASLAVDLIYPLYALALGLAAVSSRHALVSSARSQDQASAELELQQEVRASAEYADAATRAAETRLHETVLNTLTAIVRGGFAADATTQTRIREHASEAADVLTMISDGADASVTWMGDLTIDLATSLVDLRALGVDVAVHGTMRPQIDSKRLQPPSQANGRAHQASEYLAMGNAVREVLLNVMRHANPTHVSILGDVTRAQGRAWWRVVVRDDGGGFDGHTLGYGLRNVVFDGLRSVGGQVQISSSPGAGTQVTLEVPVSSESVSSAQQRAGVLRSIGGPVLAAFGALTAYVVVATWSNVNIVWANLVAIGLFGVATGVLLAAMRRGDYRFAPWWAVVAIALVVPIMTQFEAFAAGVAGPTADWSSEAGAALLFIVVAAGPWWAAPVALVSWFIAQDSQWIELTQPGTVVIVVAAILGWNLRRADAATRQRIGDIDDQLQALAVSQSSLSNIRQRYAQVDAEGLSQLLRNVADGSLDPHDEYVRDECTRQERMLRSVLLLHPESNPVHRDLALLAAVARDRNIDLSISAEPDNVRASGLHTFEDARDLLTIAAPGSTARASVSMEGQGCVFRLVAIVRRTEAAHIPGRAEVLDEEQGLVAIEEVCAPDLNAPH